MGLLATVQTLVTGGGRGPLAWAARVDREKPGGYDDDVEALLSYYRRRTRADTEAQLAKHFRRTHARMIPVALPLVPKLARELAQTFAGDGQVFGLVDDAGQPVEEAGRSKWADVLRDAELLGTLVEIDRLRWLLRRVFVRVTWDPIVSAVALSLFAPNKAWPRFPTPDGHRHLANADGMLAEAAAAWTPKGDKVRRFEEWTADHVRIEDETGKLLSENPNELRDDEDLPVLPWVDFRAADAGLDEDWPAPSEELLDAARAVNVQTTNEFHVLYVQGYGQWIAERVEAGAEQWTGEITFGPDRVPKCPKGWRLTHVSQSAPLDGLRASRRAYLQDLAAFEGLPAGTVLAEARQVPTGVALEIERRPLLEIREDSVRRSRRSVERLLRLIRLVWNTYGTDTDADRFRGVREVWTPGDLRGPQDPETQNRVARQRVDLGLTSAPRLLAEETGTTLEEARVQADAIAAENGASPSVSKLADELDAPDDAPGA